MFPPEEWEQSLSNTRMLSQLLHRYQSQATINIVRKSFDFLKRATKQMLSYSSSFLDKERMALTRKETPVSSTLPSFHNPTYTKQYWKTTTQ